MASERMPTPPSGGIQMDPPDIARSGERSLGDAPLAPDAVTSRTTAPLDDMQKKQELYLRWGINE
ncbi:MAG TPA: hypothetical protein VGR14_12665 [Verrucomicrobiae bacterium]|nr:hypothetical protein [Verrucomicrobiae bacterium]